MFLRSGSQKSKINQFILTTNANEETAMQFLSLSNWSLRKAIDNYLNSCTSTQADKGPQADSKEINKVFDIYKDKEEDAILVEGMERLCKDLLVDPADVSMLILACEMNASQMCIFTRQEWLKGWTTLGCDSFSKMRNVMPTLPEKMKDSDFFRELYSFSFQFGLMEQQKSLPLDVAVPFWGMLLKNKFPLLDEWIEFVEVHHGKSISKDTWQLFLDFVETMEENFTNYDVNGAWPVLIDEFVEHIQRKRLSS